MRLIRWAYEHQIYSHEVIQYLCEQPLIRSALCTLLKVDATTTFVVLESMIINPSLFPLSEKATTTTAEIRVSPTDDVGYQINQLGAYLSKRLDDMLLSEEQFEEINTIYEEQEALS